MTESRGNTLNWIGYRILKLRDLRSHRSASPARQMDFRRGRSESITQIYVAQSLTQKDTNHEALNCTVHIYTFGQRDHHQIDALFTESQFGQSRGFFCMEKGALEYQI